jgi:hypothetical protein
MNERRKVTWREREKDRKRRDKGDSQKSKAKRGDDDTSDTR